MNYRMKISYDGTRYKGWQRLKNTDMTVQTKIENILFEMLYEPVELIASGRTDKGAHAIGQVANFKTSIDIPTKELKEYLYRYLPDDIVVTSVKKVEENFHSRYHAKEKTYIYKIYNDYYHDPFLRKTSLHVQESLNMEAMKKAADHFIGEYDFSAFTTKKSKTKSMVREIYNIEILKSGHEIDFKVTGNGFLHHMVRTIVGTLVEVGLGRIKPNDIKNIIESKDKLKTGPTLPAKGLYLYDVKY